MKIGILIDEVRFGGVEKVAIEQVRALSAVGHTATLLVLRRTRSDAFQELLSGVAKIYVSDFVPKPLRISFRLPFFRFFSLFHLSYALLAQFIALPWDFDVIICHGTFTCFTGLNLARKRSTPVIAFVWDPIVHILQKVYFRSPTSRMDGPSRVAHSVGMMLDRWICNHSDIVLTASRSHARLLGSISSNRGQIRLLFPGVDVSTQIKTQRKKLAITVTAWKRGKDPEYIIDLAHRVRGLKFVLAGAWLDQSMKSTFYSQLRTHGLTDQVSIVGPLNEKSLLNLYSEALVLLQLRADRGFGLPALEAAGQGCTFIVPQDQGVCEVFNEGVEGFVTRERDTLQITQLLTTLVEKPDVAVAMGRNAWKTAHVYSWRRHAENLCNIILESKALKRTGLHTHVLEIKDRR